jgi:hypothetical protein
MVCFAHNIVDQRSFATVVTLTSGQTRVPTAARCISWFEDIKTVSSQTHMQYKYTRNPVSSTPRRSVVPEKWASAARMQAI